MKFTKEAALELSSHVWDEEEIGRRSLQDVGKIIAARVYISCQKAFEEERQDLKKSVVTANGIALDHEQKSMKLSEELKRTKDLLVATERSNRSLEEERETIISGTDILISEIRGQLQNSVQLKLQAQEELKIAKRIVAQQQEQIAELRKERDAYAGALENNRVAHDNTRLELACIRKALEKQQQPSFPPPGAPNPGEGYRLLDPEKDEKRATDERAYKGEDSLFWTVVVPDGEFSEKCWYRRKIEPAPVEPDPLEALLPRIKSYWTQPTDEVNAICILIDRELARTRKPSA